MILENGVPLSCLSIKNGTSDSYSLLRICSNCEKCLASTLCLRPCWPLVIITLNINNWYFFFKSLWTNIWGDGQTISVCNSHHISLQHSFKQDACTEAGAIVQCTHQIICITISFGGYEMTFGCVPKYNKPRQPCRRSL